MVLYRVRVYWDPTRRRCRLCLPSRRCESPGSRCIRMADCRWGVAVQCRFRNLGTCLALTGVGVSPRPDTERNAGGTPTKRQLVQVRRRLCLRQLLAPLTRRERGWQLRMRCEYLLQDRG